MNAEQKTNFKQVAEKISLELVYAEPGKDSGLLPINSLLSEIEGLPLEAGGPNVIAAGVKHARQWVDRIFDATATWDQPTLKRFGEWSAWSQIAADAWIAGQSLPAVPASWNQPFASPSPAAVAAAAPATETFSEAQAPLLMNIESDGDLLREFTNESQEHLQNIEQGVLVLEDNPRDRDTLNSIFRAFHTFKGGSGLLNLMPMNRTAHELENLLDLARQDKLEITLEIINLILEGGDVLKSFIEQMNEQLSGRKPLAPIVVPTADLLSRVRVAVSGGRPAPAAAQAAGAVPAGVSHPAAEVVSPASPAATSSPVPTAAATAAAGKAASAAATASAAAATVKVDTVKLDSLVDLVGEMVIAQSMVQLDPEVTRLSNQNLNRNMAQLGRITKELQRIAMSMRMVPIRPTFQKMNRLVRDVAAKQSKEVELVLGGEDTELDRTIVEEISDPLVHMIRNAVDHGIEKPEQRTKAGKPSLGTIRLTAYHQGGNIVIQIKDDGGGLRKDKILKKAIEKGIIKADQQLPDKEIFDLIFAPGFSTADQITDISGRGVGMDVVKRNIEKLRGKVEITSVEGQGSVFNIYLPLTLAIIDGLIVNVGNERFILPTLSVRESFRPTPQMLSTVHERGEMVNVRGRLYPLLRLYKAFGIQPKSENPEEGIVIVIEAGQDVRCILVDVLLGKQEVVIKSLGETFKANPAVAGAAIMGDGRVGLILDVNTLVRIRQMGPVPVGKAA